MGKIFTRVRRGPGGGLNFVFIALRPFVSEIELSDVLHIFTKVSLSTNYPYSSYGSTNTFPPLFDVKKIASSRACSSIVVGAESIFALFLVYLLADFLAFGRFF